MIEIIYNESGKCGSSVVVKPPKNIRQIGSPRGRHKIYVEDYVYTFLHSAAFEGAYQKRGAVLLGKSEMSQDIRYTFISGAVSCDQFIFQEEGILFDESCWEYIYKEIKQYFDNQEIVGWFLGLTGFPLELTPVVESAHRKYFAGRDKVLFLSEPAEGEDVFFTYEQGILQKKEGYYVYYEKNLPMQEYMVTSRERSRELFDSMEERAPISEMDGGGLSELEAAEKLFFREKQGQMDKENSSESGLSEKEIHPEKAENGTKTADAAEEKTEPMTSAEQALQNYRSMLLERKGTRSQRKVNGLLYTAAAVAMVILCVIGITTMNNFEKMKQVQEALAAISHSSESEDETGEEPSEGVTVESVPGQVTPQQEDSADTESSEPQNGENGAAGQQNTDSPSTTVQPGTDGQSGADGQTATDPSAGSGQTDPNQPGAGGQPEAGSQTQTPENTTVPDQTEAAETSAQTYLEQGYYIVQSGDKLELICKNIYQTTAMLDKLCEANQITDVDKIYAGQKLVLP